MLKKGDILLVLVLSALVLLGYGGYRYVAVGNTGNERIAVIKQDQKVIRRIDLNKIKEPERIDVSKDFHETILVESGRIRFEDADCPDRKCVKTGWLKDPGQAAVCLPNRTIIRIEGEGEEIDGGTY